VGHPISDPILSEPFKPVVGVSWELIENFCKWFEDSSNYHNLHCTITTEAQWLLAAGITLKHKYPWGNEEPDDTKAHYNRLFYQGTAVVGSFPNGRGPYGHLDLAGNMWELCFNDHDFKFGKAKIAKGGSHCSGPSSLEISSRVIPNELSPSVGFRIVVNDPFAAVNPNPTHNNNDNTCPHCNSSNLSWVSLALKCGECGKIICG
jgi:formylglycine-generating enzyme required for sulfatase activity